MTDPTAPDDAERDNLDERFAAFREIAVGPPPPVGERRAKRSLRPRMLVAAAVIVSMVVIASVIATRNRDTGLATTGVPPTSTAIDFPTGTTSPPGASVSSGSSLAPDCPGTRPDQQAMSRIEIPTTTQPPATSYPSRNQNPSPEMFEVIHAYALSSSDEYVDSWIDRSQRGSPIVVAFTDHLDQHRAELLAARAQAGDPPMTVQAATPGGGDKPANRVTNGTTLGEAGWPIQVVQMNDRASQVMGLRNRVILYGQTIDRKPALSASNNVNAQGRLEIFVEAITDDLRRDLATRFGQDKICVRVIKVASAIS